MLCNVNSSKNKWWHILKQNSISIKLWERFSSVKNLQPVTCKALPFQGSGRGPPYAYQQCTERRRWAGPRSEPSQNVNGNTQVQNSALDCNRLYLTWQGHKDFC